MVSCGGASSTSGSQEVLGNGNWYISGASTTSTGQAVSLGGGLTQSGSTISGTLQVSDYLNNVSDCLISSDSVAFSGSYWNDSLTLTSQAINGNVITAKMTGSGGSLSGTYVVAGDTAGCDDKGTIVATYVPPLTGSWSGAFTNPDGSLIGLNYTVELTQGAVTANGSSPLTGTVTGSSTTGNFAGSTLQLSTSGTTTSAVTGDVVYLPFGASSFVGTITDPATATEITGIIRSGDFGLLQTGFVTLTKAP